MECLVEVKDLRYSYSNGKEALRGVSLQIRQGEKVAVLGANGAGKSTLFLNMNGVLTPTEGEIFYRGALVGHHKKDLNRLRRNIGIVFQDADNQIIAPTVQAEISFGPMNLKLSREEVIHRVNKAMDALNLKSFKDRAPHYLSGGEKKRVTIADILAMEPEIIIFDEPTASLDPVNAQILEDALNQIEQEGTTLLISTHDVDFAYRWASRILVFFDGQIIADGSPVDIFKNQETLDRANLKRPMLLDIYEMLEARGLAEKGKYPQNLKAFESCIQNEKNPD